MTFANRVSLVLFLPILAANIACSESSSPVLDNSTDADKIVSDSKSVDSQELLIYDLSDQVFNIENGINYRQDLRIYPEGFEVRNFCVDDPNTDQEQMTLNVAGCEDLPSFSAEFDKMSKIILADRSADNRFSLIFECNSTEEMQEDCVADNGRIRIRYANEQDLIRAKSAWEELMKNRTRLDR